MMLGSLSRLFLDSSQIIPEISSALVNASFVLDLLDQDEDMARDRTVSAAARQLYATVCQLDTLLDGVEVSQQQQQQPSSWQLSRITSKLQQQSQALEIKVRGVANFNKTTLFLPTHLDPAFAKSQAIDIAAVRTMTTRLVSMFRNIQAAVPATSIASSNTDKMSLSSCPIIRPLHRLFSIPERERIAMFPANSTQGSFAITYISDQPESYRVPTESIQVYRLPEGSLVKSLTPPWSALDKMYYAVPILSPDHRYMWIHVYKLGIVGLTLMIYGYDTKTWEMAVHFSKHLNKEDCQKEQEAVGDKRVWVDSVHSALSEDGGRLAIELGGSIYIWTRNRRGFWDANTPVRIRKLLPAQAAFDGLQSGTRVNLHDIRFSSRGDRLFALSIGVPDTPNPRALIQAWHCDTGTPVDSVFTEISKYHFPFGLRNHHPELKTLPIHMKWISDDRAILWKLRFLKQAEAIGILDMQNGAWLPLSFIDLPTPCQHDHMECTGLWTWEDTQQRRRFLALSYCAGKGPHHAYTYTAIDVWDLENRQRVRSFKYASGSHPEFLWVSNGLLCCSEITSPGVHGWTSVWQLNGPFKSQQGDMPSKKEQGY